MKTFLLSAFAKAASSPGHHRGRIVTALVTFMWGTLAWAMLAAPVSAQERCRFLCAPSLNVEPTVTFSNLFNRHRVHTSDGTTETATREPELEIILALDIPTRLPRLGFTVEAIWTPFGSTSVNPFTGQTASDLGVSDIRDNPVELEFEANLTWLRSEQTAGWVSSHFDIVDKFSPAERPQDTSTYTHKLNVELDTAVSVFNWLPEPHWLRHVEIEGSLDYVATGLPRTGDVFPSGEVLLDDVSAWSFSLVFVIPVAPVP